MIGSHYEYYIVLSSKRTSILSLEKAYFDAYLQTYRDLYFFSSFKPPAYQVILQTIGVSGDLKKGRKGLMIETNLPQSSSLQRSLLHIHKKYILLVSPSYRTQNTTNLC